jgi:hypothetical protein
MLQGYGKIIGSQINAPTKPPSDKGG